MREKSKSGVYWAYIIVGAIVLNICAAVYTVVLSTDYPLDYDESYFMPYQQVENDFINIQAAEAEFNRHFKIRVDGGKRTQLSITKKPALLLKDNETFKVIIYGQNAANLLADLRIKQPQDTQPARSMPAQITRSNGALSIELSANELKPGRNTLMMQLSAPESASKEPASKHLPQAAASIIHAQRFVKLELCKDACAVNFKLPDGAQGLNIK